MALKKLFLMIILALSDNKILNLTFTHEFEVLRTDIDTHNEFLDQTRPPIGNIFRKLLTVIYCIIDSFPWISK